MTLLRWHFGQKRLTPRYHRTLNMHNQLKVVYSVVNLLF